ncbi:MAG: hypothetical protein WCC84_13530 [Candidatus Cybelea sp.]
MNTISRVPYGLSVCVAAAMLAGCGGSAQLPNPATQAPLGRIGSNSSGNEVLKGRVHTHCKYHAGLFTSCEFHTKGPGKATGPYPGTFTASGGYEQQEWYPFYSFGESFTITSGTSQITGSIFYSTSSGYQYTSSVGNGTADVSVGRHIDDVLNGL